MREEFRIPHPSMSVVDTELLTKKELSQRMKVCERTIEVLCNDSKIPVIRFGRLVRYKWQDVLSALENTEDEARLLNLKHRRGQV